MPEVDEQQVILEKELRVRMKSFSEDWGHDQLDIVEDGPKQLHRK